MVVIAAPVIAQHEHHMMHPASAARVEVQNDSAARVLTVRVGPLDLPAHADHMTVAQPSPQFVIVPFDGWITAYHPRLVDDAGAVLPARLLHHVAFWNTARANLLCPSADEHIFGAGGEMNDWPVVPGFGYRVHPGDRIRITSMFHNPTDADYPRAWLQVKLEYVPASAGPLQSVYPIWLDVKQCGDSSYDLAPGRNVTTGQFTLGYSGVLLGVGGHMHDYGRELSLENVSRSEQVARLHAKLDAQGHIESMPVVVFAERGGYPVQKGDILKITGTYDNPTGRALPAGAMGIVVGYFLPANDRDMAGLARKAPMREQQASR